MKQRQIFISKCGKKNNETTNFSGKVLLVSRFTRMNFALRRGKFHHKPLLEAR